MGTAEAIVNWDMETMMPPRAVELRSEQLGVLSQIHHKMSTSPQIGKLLKALDNQKFKEMDEVKKRNVELIRKNYEEQTKLSTKLVKDIARQQAMTVNSWKKAKAAKDYSIFKPDLTKLVTLNKQAAEILRKVKQTKTSYDALLDIYEPKMNAEVINGVFEELKSGIQRLLCKIEAASFQPNKDILLQEVPTEKQRQISRTIAKLLGYDVASPNSGGRIDETEHPFTTGYYDDVRITTHYHRNNFANSIFSVLHETGHALYEQNLPQKWKYMPVGAPCSLGFHESQSRLYENIIGRSLEYWIFALPKIKSNAAPILDSLKLKNFIRTINAVKPSKIRIEADEVTYNLHVIIRFQIENALFEDKLGIDELPEVWNQKYKETLGLDVKNDSEGMMQDTHWASGLYGYFPTYALGNIYSGQIVNAMEKDESQWRIKLSEGSLAPIQNWLQNKIYSKGNLYDPKVLIKRATGTELNVQPYLNYLERKFSRLYEF
jgi:carboxypeptidase Taq